MGSTPYFNLAFFDFGDTLTGDNIQAEIDRFMIIDKQLYGLYNVFGNGVVSGWSVLVPSQQSTNDIAVNIAPGLGIISFMAAETLFQGIVHGLPPNQTVYIYASVNGTTASNRVVAFGWSYNSDDTTGILLAEVSTSANGIDTINNTLRTEIGFEAIITQQVAQHKHRGVPSKIDLEFETKNQLPGSKIANLSASQITSGVLSVDRLPQIDHNNLLNRGVLTHAQLESFIRTFSQQNANFMGEINCINFLRSIIFLKYKFADVDQDFINELMYVPGVSPLNFVDWDNTTAQVNLTSGCISGKPVQTGEIVSVAWNTLPAFQSNVAATNVDMNSSGVFLSRGINQILLVEGFESTNTGSAIPLFTSQTVVVLDDTGVTADNTEQIQGAYSGLFKVEQQLRSIWTRTLAQPADWTLFEKLYISVRCTNSNHGQIFLYLVNGSGSSAVRSSPFLLLDTNNTTSSNNDNFIQLIFDLSTVIKNDVTQFVIYAEDTQNDFEFNVDNIEISQSGLYMPNGIIRFRHVTSDPVIFNSIIFNATTPGTTNIKFRIRVADDTQSLTTTAFTPYLNSSDTFSYRGTVCEVEAQLYSDTLMENTPVLDSVFLYFISNSDINGFLVETAEQFRLGTYNNLTISNAPVVMLESPIQVGDTYFLNNNVVQEVGNNLVPVFGLNGIDLPPSTVQSYNILFNPTNLNLGFSNARCVTKDGKKLLVSDTLSNRLIEMDTSGNILAIYASHQIDLTYGQTLRPLQALTANYNPNNGCFYVTWTRAFLFDANNLGTMKLTWDTDSFVLNLTDTLVPTEYTYQEWISAGKPKVPNKVLKSDLLIIVQLSTEHQAQLAGVISDLSLSFLSAPTPNYSITNLSDPSATLSVYVGNMYYTNNIFYPVHASYLESGDIIVCCAGSIDGVTTVTSYPDIASFMSFSPLNLQKTFIADIVDFSLAYLGSIYEVNGNELIVCGLNYLVNASSGKKEGRMYHIAKDTGKIIFEWDSADGLYPSDAYFDIYDRYVIAESSDTAGGGRIITVDNTQAIVNQIAGTFTVINKISLLSDGNLLVSV